MKNPNSLKKYILSSAVVMAALCMNSCTNSNKGDLAISGKSGFADTAVSTVRLYKDAQGREVLQKNNTYYDIVEYHDSVGAKKILLKITKAETGFVDSTNSQSHFIVSTVNITTTKPGWKKEFPGSDLDYSTKVLVAHNEGRNQNEEDTYTQYSLTTGEKLMTYTYAPLSVLILGDGRFLGYLSQQSATDKPDGFAIVSYVSRNEVIDRVRIRVKSADTTLPAYTPELKMRVAQESGNTLTNEGKTVIMGHVDKGFSAKDINNFAMEINYTPSGGKAPISILLPVREDHLDIANASYDKAIFELSKAN
jgi:hypothetical protein